MSVLEKYFQEKVGHGISHTRVFVPCERDIFVRMSIQSLEGITKGPIFARR